MAITLDKPAGLPVFPPHAEPDGDCLLHRLQEQHPAQRDIDWPAGFEGGIAHRLDNATSGAVIVAQSLDELVWLRQQFREHQFVKTYLMLAHTDVSWDQRKCVLAMAHHPRKKNRMVVQSSPTTAHRGKWYPAHSEFRREQGRLWRVRITTGIMHQIRAHAAHLGIPIKGDRLYGGGESPHMRFHLHHLGIKDPNGFASSPVALPDWAKMNIHFTNDAEHFRAG